MKHGLHIVLSDRGWILEKLASEMAERLPYVSYDISVNPHAHIQYYMTYNCFRSRVSPVEAGLFTHREQQEGAAARFDEVAREIDVRIAMSGTTANQLPPAPGRITETISPGVDLEKFRPRVRIGIVGRTYGTGRKGEALVAAVQDVEGIEWCFTGEGWPGPALHVPEAELAAFYRSLDYVLVPALIEGGPMSVLEALASGVEVIGAPAVGWITDFPHIPFERGNPDSLRAVLEDVVAKRTALRRSVEGMTWDAWADRHDALFRRVAPAEAFEMPRQPPPTALRAAITVHGQEVLSSLGGPSVRAPLTARALSLEGVRADFQTDQTLTVTDYDLVHAMNVWKPDDCAALLDQARRADRATVLSSIYLDLSEHDIYSRLVLEIFSRSTAPEIVFPAFEAVRARVAERRSRPAAATEVTEGYFDAIRGLFARSDHVIYLSEHEKERLAAVGVSHPSSSIIQNCLTSDVFWDGDPRLFEEEFGLRDYVLVTGRIEPRKNQATLAFALRDAPYPVVFMGHTATKGYSSIVHSVAGPNAVFIDRLEPGSAMLASAFAGARVFCLPSWSEGAPLAAIEAAAAGCMMVLSDRSSEREYFGDLAYYCDPADPAQMRERVDLAYQEGMTPHRAERLEALVREKFSLERYAASTRSAYEIALSRNESRSSDQPETTRVLVDLTTLAHRGGPPSGIARTEERLAVELMALEPERVTYVVWNSHFEKFIAVPSEALNSGNIRSYCGAEAQALIGDPNSRLTFDAVDFGPGDSIVVFGGAWIRNPRYIRDLVILKKAFGIPVITTVYDVIQWKMETMFPAGIGKEFSENCKKIIAISDLVLTCSECSRRDIIEFGRAHQVTVPPINVFRLGDATVSIDPTAELQIDRVSELAGDKPFVLFVSAIDSRKNHRLLIDIWNRFVDTYGTQTPNLVLVGSKGWGSEAIVAAASSAKLKPYIHVLHGINDLTLEWLYRNCAFTVYPSLYEGWGLPVAESLKYGKFCLAADAGSVPEIAPEIVELLDPLDFLGWYRAIDRHLTFPALLARKEALVATYEPTSWAQTARQILGDLWSVRSHWQAPVVEPGKRLFVRPNPKADAPDFFGRIDLGGFGRIERNGVWTVGNNAVLKFDTRLRAPSFLVFKIVPFTHPSRPSKTVGTIVNSVLTANITITRPSWITIPLDLPTDGTVHPLRMQMHIHDPVNPSSISDSSDNRMLGVKLEEISVQPYVELQEDRWSEDISSDPQNMFFFVRGADASGPTTCSLKVLTDVDTTLVISDFQEDIREVPVKKGREQDILCILPPIEEQQPYCHAVRVWTKADKDFRIIRLGLFEGAPGDVLSRDRHGPLHPGYNADKALRWIGKPLELGKNKPARIENSPTLLSATTGGWHPANAGLIWSSGSPSTIFVAPSVDMTAPLLRARLQAFSGVVGPDGTLPVQIQVGDGPVLSFDVPASRPRYVQLQMDPSTLPAKTGGVPVTFAASRSAAPADFGLGEDTRALSFRLSGLSIGENEFCRLSRGRRHVLHSADQKALNGSWHEAEDGGAGVWSTGEESTLGIQLMDGVTDDVALTFEYEVFSGLIDEAPYSFTVSLGDSVLATVTRDSSGRSDHTVVIPSEAFKEDLARLELVFEGKPGRSPESLGLSIDKRILGFKLVSILYE